MKMLKMLSWLTFLGISMCMPAQSGAPAKPATAAPQAQPAPTIASDVDRQVSTIERELVSAAEAMPEEKFNFAPTGLNIQGSDFKGVRTFGEQVKHVAATNYLLWGAITGDKSPVAMKDDNGPDLKSKAEIIKYLKDSYAVGHKAAKTLTQENIGNTVPSPFGGSARFSWLWMATFSVAHGFDHYGQMVEYLRMNGIIPPASRQQ
ncbi:MAG TPA: DinB family protein [Terriglobales bacterium]|nr:DinB family protein [Terriglobales bacterium]